MAYFAQLDAEGIVVQVISINNEQAPDPAPANSEPHGQAFIRDVLGLPGEWRQTSFNHSFRKQYAGPGYRYDPVADVFIAPQPFLSWTLDGNYDWQPPIPRPSEGRWMWDDASQSWIALPAAPPSS